MRLDFHYDIVCPYAYIASRRVEALAARTGAELRWRPILLGGVFKALGRDPLPMRAMSAPRARQNLLDMHRQAALADAPLTLPAEHPRRTVDAMRLLIATEGPTRVALTHALYRAYWVEGRDVADRAVLAEIAAAHDVDPAVIETSATRDALYAATAEAVERGVFGVPAFWTADRLYWGADRMHLVEAALGGKPATYSPKPPTEPPVLTLFHDFASPFSYLAALEAERVAAAHGARLEWRPILLGALFRAIGTPDVPLFEMPAAKRRYVTRDLHDHARLRDVPFRFPSRFPIRTVRPLRAALVEPRLTVPLYRAAWADDRPIDDEATLAAIITEQGHDAAAILAATDTPAIKDALRHNTERAHHAGACGVPTFEVRAAPHADPILFWGQDRIEMVERALDGWRP
ncbi:MAG: 2-hydroxychromene-2-carboxylate isomerase [Myxococcales bacterium]|nr:2-hydroxychromene-2-carboxylate isomerase [Myxococcales bacterium]